jgi:hypothetical protein
MSVTILGRAEYKSHILVCAFKVFILALGSPEKVWIYQDFSLDLDSPLLPDSVCIATSVKSR